MKKSKVDYLLPYKKYYGKLKRTNDGYHITSCKCGNHKNGDEHPSLYITPDGFHGSFSCSEKGDSAKIAEKCGLDPKPYYRIDTQNKKIPPPSIKESPRNTKIITKSVSDVYPKNKYEIVTDTVVEKYHQSLLNNWSEFDWSVSKETAKGLKLGWDNGKVVIPHYNRDGDIVTLRYHKGRPVKECLDSTCFDNKNKWYPAHLIAGYDETKPIVIVAGEKDFIHAYSKWGHKYQFATPTAGEGSVPKDDIYWKDIIGLNRYIIAFDHDDAGNYGAMKFGQAIKVKTANKLNLTIFIGQWDEDLPDGWDTSDSIIKDDGKSFIKAVNKNMLKYEDLRIAYLEEEKKVLDEELYFSQQTHNNYVNVDSEELHQKAENYAEQLNVKGVDQAEPESNAKRGELLDMMQFMDKDFPEDEIIVETLLQERGVTILAGDSGVGKSYIGLEFAFCIAHGKPVFQHFKVDKPRKVRIYQFELTKSQLQKRLGQLKKNYGSTNKITLKHYEHRRLFQDRWKEIEQDLMNNGLNGGVLIIDNFYTSLDGDADPSVNKLLIPYIDKMTELADKFDVAILLINHHYKGVLDKPISADHIIGGKYLQMASSYIIQVKDSRRSADLRYAMITKTRDEYSELENKPWKLRWNPDEHIWTKEEMIKNEQAHLFEPSERWELGVVQSMKQYEDSGNNPKKGGEWTRELIWNHIQATLDWARNKSNENKVTRLIKRLCDWGAIKKQAHNTYVILDNELTLGE